jgi:magnesium chelatase family protein
MSIRTLALVATSVIPSRNVLAASLWRADIRSASLGLCWIASTFHVDAPRVKYGKLTADRLGEPSGAIRARVEKARCTQRRRSAGTGLSRNADLGPAEVREYSQVDEAGRSLLRAAMQQLKMSARAFDGVLKLARSIADLSDAEDMETAHLAEAIQYRPRTHR